LTGVLDMDVASGVEKGGRNREVKGFRSGDFVWLAGMEMEMMVISDK